MHTHVHHMCVFQLCSCSTYNIYSYIHFITYVCLRLVYFKVTPGGALAAVLFGSILRAILEYALPKDGLLAIPHGEFNFDYGAGEVGFIYLLFFGCLSSFKPGDDTL